MERNLSSVIEHVWNELKDTGLITHSVDTCPYTESFERVFIRVSHTRPCTRNEVYRELMNLRKQGKCHAPDEISRAYTGRCAKRAKHEQVIFPDSGFR